MVWFVKSSVPFVNLFTKDALYYMFRTTEMYLFMFLCVNQGNGTHTSYHPIRTMYLLDTVFRLAIF